MTDAPTNDAGIRYKQVVCGYSSCCAIKSSGEVVCWGGQGGTSVTNSEGTTTYTQEDITTPVKKDNGEYIIYSEIAAAAYTYCAIAYGCVSTHAHPRAFARLETVPTALPVSSVSLLPSFTTYARKRLAA